MRRISHSRDARLEEAQKYPGCRLLLSCGGCEWSRAYDLAKIINRLYVLRDGGFMTPVVDVAKRVKRSCPGCGRRQWATELVYPDDLTEREARRLAGRYRN